MGNNVLPIDNKTKLQVNPNTNRFTTGQGYVYNFNGNLIQDAENRGFTFNGDDRQTVVRDLTIPTSPQNPDANVVGKYYYDGEGKRVKKVTNTETVVFIYNAGGSLAAEYSTAAPPANPTISYLTTDNLGSPRVVTDKIGNVISRRDFLPFGEEILAGVGARDTINLKYTANGRDNVRQRFTGYQKDEETGNIDTALDFAEARMYQNRHGRFTAPDPLLSSASLDNPQTFNRYVYVGNNPVNLTDPSGLDWCGNANGVATFRTGACDKPGDRVTSARASANGFDSNGRTVTEGETVDLHDDGTLTVRRPITQQEESQVAAHTGAEVRASSDPAQLTTSSIISSTVQTRSTDIYPALTINEPPEPLVSETTLDTIQLTLAGFGQIPGPGEVADVIDTLISLARGDYVGAGAGVLSVIPVIGNAAGAAKIARKLDKLTDATNAINGNSKLSTKAQHLYEVVDTSTGNVVKTGISDGKITKAGKSYRATSQVNPWNKAEGAGKYDSRIVKNVRAGKGARAKILKAEKRNADKYRNTLDPFKHRRP